MRTLFVMDGALASPRTSARRCLSRIRIQWGIAMKLLEQVRQTLRTLHYAYRTEQCYCLWIVQFIRFHGIRHPDTMGASEVEEFLTHLATARHVSASTQNQALNALVFLYKHVLKREIGDLN